MGNLNVLWFVIWCSNGFFMTVSCVKFDSEVILSDEFINEINSVQNSWKARRNFHKKSELRNLISISFKRQYNLSQKVNKFNGSIPMEFDSRSEWPFCKSIGDIKTQGNCASSYAIVASSVFADRLCVQRNITRTSSANQVLTCCKHCGGGCFGGHIERSFEYMIATGSVSGGGYRSAVGCRPYDIDKCPSVQKSLPLCPRIRAKTPSCYFWKCSNGHFKNLTYNTDKIKMKNVYAVPTKVDAIKRELMTNGPVSATFSIHEDFFNYKSGVYYHVHGAKVGEFDVKLIGWGRTSKSKPYWLAINSWGKTWGDNGTFKIKLGINECDIESHVLTGSFV